MELIYELTANRQKMSRLQLKRSPSLFKSSSLASIALGAVCRLVRKQLLGKLKVVPLDGTLRYFDFFGFCNLSPNNPHISKIIFHKRNCTVVKSKFKVKVLWEAAEPFLPKNCTFASTN